LGWVKEEHFLVFVYVIYCAEFYQSAGFSTSWLLYKCNDPYAPITATEQKLDKPAFSTPLSSAQPFTLESTAVRDALANHLSSYGVESDAAIEQANAIAPAIQNAVDTAQIEPGQHLNFHDDGGVSIGEPIADANVKSVPLESVAAVQTEGMPTEGIQAIRENVAETKGMSDLDVVSTFGHDVAVSIGSAGYPAIEVSALKESLEPHAIEAGAAPGSVTDAHALKALGDIARGKEEVSFHMPAAEADHAKAAETPAHTGSEAHASHAHHASHHTHHHGHTHGHAHVTASAHDLAKHANLMAPAAYGSAVIPEHHAAVPAHVMTADEKYYAAERAADAQVAQGFHNATHRVGEAIASVSDHYRASQTPAERAADDRYAAAEKASREQLASGISEAKHRVGDAVVAVADHFKSHDTPHPAEAPKAFAQLGSGFYDTQAAAHPLGSHGTDAVKQWQHENGGAAAVAFGSPQHPAAGPVQPHVEHHEPAMSLGM
jgi:hypothetical protein